MNWAMESKGRGDGFPDGNEGKELLRLATQELLTRRVFFGYGFSSISSKGQVNQI